MDHHYPKNLPHPISAATNLILFIMTIAWAVAVFSPTFLELALILAIDFVAYAILVPIDVWYFRRRYPQFNLIFPTVQDQKIQALSAEQRIQFFQNLIQFPRIRSAHFLLSTSVKLFPSALIVVFVWKHQTTHIQQFLQFFFMEAAVQTFVVSVLFVEYHRLVPKIIAKLHHDNDWSETFKNAVYPNAKHEFFLQEAISLSVIIALMITVQTFTIAISPNATRMQLALKCITIGILSFIVFARIWFLSRSTFIDGLETLFKRFESIDYGDGGKTIPLHSLPLLARFEKTFNALIERLRGTERQLSEWTVFETEQGRYRALGEFSGLVAHDLVGPLSVVQFCATELISNPESIRKPRYIEQLATNTKRAIDLVVSLRAYLKNPDSKETGIIFSQAHQYVHLLLKTQFHQKNFNEVTFEIDATLDETTLQISQVDLVHILYNLYKNSIENLLNNSVPNSRIQVRLAKTEENKATIHIHDNGTGLDPERFETMTAFQFLPTGGNFREGLGLRLTRRLIERNQGSLQIVRQNGLNGTIFELVLPIQ